MKYAVLGAGVSGLSAARLLKDKGIYVTVYEKESTIGGLARTRFKDGYLYDPYGGHIFNSKNKDVVDWVFSIFPKKNWQFTVRNAKIYFNGKYVSYPFELSLCELEQEDAVKCVYDFVISEHEKSSVPEPDNYRDWLYWNFGKGIADYYMIPYNEKIWAYPLEKMETHWMQGKMPLPEGKDILKSLVLKDSTERKMPHSTFYYPLKGGIQSFINAMAEGLEIKLNYSIKSIKKNDDDKWIINDSEIYDNIISTIPLPELPQIMYLPEEINNHIKDLKFNSLNTVLFRFPQNTDITWLYIPSKDYKAHRVGYQSALTPYATPKKEEGCGALEIIGNKLDINSTFAQSKNILPNELGFKEVLDHEWCKYAYVIHDTNYRKSINSIKDYFSKDKTFNLLGRWGTWNYNNMDMCILDSMKLVKELK